MSKALKLRLAAVPAFARATKTALVALPLALAGAAHAALPAAATTAMDDMADDAKLLAGAFLVVCIVIGAIKVLKKGAN